MFPVLKAIILSAGQGKRLLPLTADRPKCLLNLAGRTLLEWQVRALAECGVAEVVVVTGFGSSAVEDAVSRIAEPDIRVRTLFNPFFKVADNIGSCFVARHEMDEEFLLLNGDTLIEPAIVSTLLAERTAPITVTIDRKARYDDDDMKVCLDGSRLTAIGKKLPMHTVNAESIGLLRFQHRGAELFRRGVEAVLREPDGLGRFYLSVIDQLAATAHVGTADIVGRRWSEVDYPVDLARAEDVASGWWAHDWAPVPAADLPATG